MVKLSIIKVCCNFKGNTVVQERLGFGSTGRLGPFYVEIACSPFVKVCLGSKHRHIYSTLGWVTEQTRHCPEGFSSSSVNFNVCPSMCHLSCIWTGSLSFFFWQNCQQYRDAAMQCLCMAYQKFRSNSKPVGATAITRARLQLTHETVVEIQCLAGNA